MWVHSPVTEILRRAALAVNFAVNLRIGLRLPEPNVPPVKSPQLVTYPEVPANRIVVAAVTEMSPGNVIVSAILSCLEKRELERRFSFEVTRWPNMTFVS
jgi:hypothetical protein